LIPQLGFSGKKKANQRDDDGKYEQRDQEEGHK